MMGGRAMQRARGRLAELDLHRYVNKELPVSMNPYILDADNPIGNVDPSGHDEISATTVVSSELSRTVPSTRPSTQPSFGPRSEVLGAVFPQILDIDITPILLVAPGSNVATSDILVSNFVRELTMAQNYWVGHAGINIRWGQVIVDGSGKHSQIDIGVMDGNSKDAIDYYYQKYGRHIVVLYGAHINDTPLRVSALQSHDTNGYTPGDFDEGVVTQAVGAETIAHELGHLFIGDSSHMSDATNLMARGSDRGNTGLSLEQFNLTDDQITIARYRMITVWGNH
jgi:hypothetical protein